MDDFVVLTSRSLKTWPKGGCGVISTGGSSTNVRVSDEPIQKLSER
jgi:hypothetical protein